jgi:hypothetical protein
MVERMRTRLPAVLLAVLVLALAGCCGCNPPGINPYPCSSSGKPCGMSGGPSLGVTPGIPTIQEGGHGWR